MPTPDKHRLEFVESVETLGGPLRASELSGTPRSTIVHWMRIGWPHYRQHEVDKLNELARKEDLATLERLQRKYRAADAEKLVPAGEVRLVLAADERKRRPKAAK